MAPHITPRQLLALSLPTLAVLLSYFWYKKRRIGGRSDPGIIPKDRTPDSAIPEKTEGAEEGQEEVVTPTKSFSRSLSGVESTPIDIVLPPSLRASRSSPIVISDEDLDIEIEKIKSMRSGPLFGSKSQTPSPPQQQVTSTTPQKTPQKSAQPQVSSEENNNKKTTPSKNKKNKKKMAQKDTVVAEESLKQTNNVSGKEVVLKKDKMKKNGRMIDDEQQPRTVERQSSERDSANHSPSDAMLASPTLSSISDNHSEGSSDSGKGGSDLATPPPSRTPRIEDTDVLSSYYEFFIPQNLVGKMIGKHGSSIAHIRERTNAMVVLKKHPTNNKVKICSLEGTKKEIDTALKLIRDKFPAKRYPEITLEQVHVPPTVPTIPLTPDHLYLKLVEGINNDTIVSCVVAPNHLFLQQPTHPSFPSLNVLTNYMNACYSDAESPLLPDPTPQNTVCAAYSGDMWYRAMVLDQDAENDTSYVKYLDFGGYSFVENSNLRQIRGDFMLLPFQAAECFLANITSVNEDGSWPQEAYDLVIDTTKGAIIYTQVADYTEDGIPLVLCYVVVGNSSVVFLNQHLVDNGFAHWVATEDEDPQQQQQYQSSTSDVAEQHTVNADQELKLKCQWNFVVHV